jgi:putative tryptophan/tyrosine transport system substrate-binding protein
MKKLTYYTCLALLLSVACAGQLSGSPALAAPLQIAVMESRSLPAYEKALQQIKSGFPLATFSVYDLAGQADLGNKALSEIKKKNVNLILTFGTLATRIAEGQETQTPIVFTFVLNPVASGLIANPDSSGRNLTGVALDIPIAAQFASFQRAIPQLNTIGVLYNPQESGAIIAEARTVAQQMGLTLKAVPVTAPEEVPHKLSQLADVDGLWMVADSVVFTPSNTEYILLYTLKNGMPAMGVSEQFVKAGALCGLSLDYDTITQQTIGQITKIMHGANPANLPIEFPGSTKLVLNLKSANIIGVRLSPEIIRQAGKLYQ